MNNHLWSAFLSGGDEVPLMPLNVEAHSASSFPNFALPGGLSGVAGMINGASGGSVGSLVSGSMQTLGYGGQQGGPPNSGQLGPNGNYQQGGPGYQQGVQGYPGQSMASSQQGGLPLSQPPPKPSFQKMYVKTTPVESFSDLVSTTHISFLWTMLMLAGGVAIGVACMAPRKKKGKDEADNKKEDDASSSSSSSSANLKMPGTLSMLKQAFSNPILEKTMAATQSYVLNKVLPPPPPPPPPPEEPYQYLPNPGPYATEFSWDYALGILGTMAGLSAAVFSFGALLGIGSSLCIGKRLKKVNEEIIETPSVDEYETWAQENYERREGPGQLRVETSGPLEPRNPDNPVVPSLP